MTNTPGTIPMDHFIELVGRSLPTSSIKVVFDVGAMDGEDALALKKGFPHARVCAIEGLRSNYERYLSRLDEIDSFCTVISNIDGWTTFYEKSINGLHGIFERESLETIGIHRVNCETLATFCSRHCIEAIDVMKLDVEGAALQVLEGMGNLLDHLKILHLETEEVPFFRGQRLHSEVVAFLQRTGFRLVEIVDRLGVLKTMQGKQYDSVWIARRFDNGGVIGD